METIKDIWYAVIDDNDRPVVAFKEKREADSFIKDHDRIFAPEAERVRVTIDRIV